MAPDGGADDAAPRTREEWFQDLAADALRNGQAALAEGALDAACAWLERAHRMAPQDVTARLSLAVLRLRRGEAAPVPELLQDIAERAGLAELWLTLAAAHDRLGQAAAAAEAMARALSGHVLADAATLAPLAEAVARAAGRPGWCGVDAGMRVVIGAAAATRVRVGGGPWRPRQQAPDADRLAVTLDGAHLLGSPIDLRRVRRLEGLVREEAGGLSGWAWLPGRPEVDPRLTVTDAAGRTLTLVAADEQALVSHAMARPRGFHLPAPRLRGLLPPLSVTGPDGRHLPGSPLDPFGPARAAAAAAGAAARLHPVACAGQPDLPPPGPYDAALALLGAPAACIGIPAAAPADPARPVTVIVPVHDAAARTLACLDSVLATLPPDATLLVVDDASRDPALVQALDALQAAGRILLLRQADNRGFASSANAGLEAAARRPGCDMVLLNSDTLATPGWLQLLRAAVHEAPDIGTATPLSNNATLLSHAGAAAAADSRAAADALALLAARVNAGVAVDIPTAVGFCMYIRRECLHATGLFRTALFAQGYGEENDFCLRARHLGWRHVGVPGAFVAHCGGASFGAAGPGLLSRNLDLLERLHPGYNALVAEFAASDPLAAARRRLDLARFRGAAGRGRAGPGAVILVTHDGGGGVERVVRARCAALAAEGRAAVVLRPVRRPTGAPGYLDGRCVVGLGAAADFPDLRFAVPAELDALAALLRPLRPAALEVHHLMGHAHAVLRLAGMLGLQADHHLHDYALFCPRVTLLGPSRSYCGEPLNPADCDSCVADAGRAIADDLPVAALWARSAADLAAARRVVVPSADAAARLRRHFPQARPEVVRLEDDSAWPDPDPPPQPQDGRRRICVIGGIGPEKGYDVLLACARDAADRRLPLEFVLVGHTPDDRRLLDTGRVFVTGPYAEADATRLVRAQRAQLAFLPSIWPETWCFALGVAWQAGLDAAAFDIGAQAERIRGRGRGLVLPLGLKPAAINKALLAIEVTSGK